MATYTCLKQHCITLHCLNDTILHHHGNVHLPETTMYHPALPLGYNTASPWQRTPA
ncbi:Hypothetical predicted protein [Pelobates cultripes]|uniref:Uncharacterized protein n=1 Tax=Pelobates cultripes TaxID=61616 RepID=A0AAD1T9C3_PELCU|nr:Hypothetical predicted protein [Pelobates cultripes]